MKKTWLRPILWWAYAAIAVTGVCALVHVAVQQDLRQGANDPQVQMAEDAASQLDAGDVPASLVQRGMPLTDIAQSLSPWVAVYDSAGKPLEASSQLDNAPPQLPQGVFDTSNWKSIVGHHLTVFYPKNESRFSWQPRPNVRQAVVLVQAQNGMYVAAGRSLREVEERESQLTFEVFALWAFTLLCLLIGSFVLDRILRK